MDVCFLSKKITRTIRLSNTHSTARKSATSDSTDDEAEQLPSGSLFNDHYQTDDQL
jgi:hypothetical protein